MSKTLLSEVIGHLEQQEQLLAVHKRQCVPHALLFCGPHGVGKRTLARAFAAALLEVEGHDSDQLVRAGSHPDLHFAHRDEGKKDLNVESVRKLCTALHFKPYLATKNVAIIDNAHEMNISAANALLKTLEEPTAQSNLILITSAPHRLPETIVSRCQKIHFSELSPDAVGEIIRRLCNKSIEEKQIELLQQISGHTLSPLHLDAFIDPTTLSVNDQDALVEHLTTLSTEMIGLQKSFRALVASGSNSSAAKALSLAAEYGTKRERPELVWATVRNECRRQLRRSSPELLAGWAELLETALESEQLVRERNLNPQLHLSSLLVHATKLAE